jgi:23S rRNA pseudouridine1911/1915/1917 synthase
MSRQALHATHLAFVHPVTRQSLVFRAPPPNDLVSLQQFLGLRYNEALQA